MAKGEAVAATSLGCRLAIALAVCLVLQVSGAWALTVVKAPDRGLFHGDGVLEIAGELIFTTGGRETRIDISQWGSQWSPVGDHVNLHKSQENGRLFRFLDRQGQISGEVLVPPGKSGIILAQGMMTQPKAYHKAIVAHELEFYSHGGELLGQASEPELLLLKSWPQPDGGIATASFVPGKPHGNVTVYAADGRVRWRHDWTGVDARAGPPEVAVTPDDRRLVLLQQELVTGPDSFGTVSRLTLLKRDGGKVATHSLPPLNTVMASPDSGMFAAAGQGLVVVLEASSGKLLWRRDERIDLVLRGGFRFDPDGEHLLIVAFDRDRAAGVAHLGMFRFKLSDGTMQRVRISEEPLDRMYTVTDVVAGENGATRVILLDRRISVSSGDWSSP